MDQSDPETNRSDHLIHHDGSEHRGQLARRQPLGPCLGPLYRSCRALGKPTEPFEVNRGTYMRIVAVSAPWHRVIPARGADASAPRDRCRQTQQPYCNDLTQASPWGRGVMVAHQPAIGPLRLAHYVICRDGGKGLDFAANQTDDRQGQCRLTGCDGHLRMAIDGFVVTHQRSCFVCTSQTARRRPNCRTDSRRRWHMLVRPDKTRWN